LDLGVLQVLERDPEPAPVAVGLADAFAQVPDDDADAPDAEGIPEQLEVACKEGLAAHLEHDLRHAGAPRVDATARAGGGDHADARKPHGRPALVAAAPCLSA